MLLQLQPQKLVHRAFNLLDGFPLLVERLFSDDILAQFLEQLIALALVGVYSDGGRLLLLLQGFELVR